MKWPKYTDLNDDQKRKLIKDKHTNGDYSLSQLAKFTGTYLNKIKRDAKRLGVKTDNQSEAQSKALRTGTLKHPTKGKKRPVDVKDQIGKSRRETWQNMTEEEQKELSKLRKEQYKKQKNLPHLSPDKHLNLQKAAKIGSKMERYLFDKLSEVWKCEHQYEGFLGQETYHVDIFVTSAKIAIEVDGPAHYEVIWDEDKLARTKEKDLRKESILKDAGIKLVRFITDKKFSKSYADEAAELIIDVCKKIKNGKNTKDITHVRL